MLAMLVGIMAIGGLVAAAYRALGATGTACAQGACATLAASRPWRARRPCSAWPGWSWAACARAPIASRRSGGAGASRLASVNSVRYEYWRVGLRRRSRATRSAAWAPAASGSSG